MSPAPQTVPNSSGSAPPRSQVPARAADCHLHIYGGRFPDSQPDLAQGTVADYRLLQRRLGVSRAVIVTPAHHRTDNAVTLDAIAQLGRDARGVAVLHPDVTDAALKTLDAGGIRGIRFTIWNPATAVTRAEMIEPLARRVHGLGWHVQIHMLADQIVAHEALWRRLPTPLVFDHLGRFPQPAGIAHPAFTVIHRLLDEGRAWVKLTGAYLNTQAGPPGYADTVPIARAFVQAAPERMVWGSDWPHPTERNKPDDAALLDLLAEWAPEESVRRRILVDNPARLYGFGAE